MDEIGGAAALFPTGEKFMGESWGPLLYLRALNRAGRAKNAG